MKSWLFLPALHPGHQQSCFQNTLYKCVCYWQKNNFVDSKIVRVKNIVISSCRWCHFLTAASTIESVSDHQSGFWSERFLQHFLIEARREGWLYTYSFLFLLVVWCSIQDDVACHYWLEKLYVIMFNDVFRERVPTIWSVWKVWLEVEVNFFWVGWCDLCMI